MSVQRILSNRGFSLTEIMVAAGIMGVLMVASATMFEYMNKEIRRIKAKQDMTSVVSDVQTKMASLQACSASIQANQAFDVGAASAPIPLNANQWNGGLQTQFLLSNGEWLAPGQELAAYDVKVEDIRWFGAAPVGTGPAGEQFFRATLMGILNHKQLSSAYSARHLGSALLKIEGGNITECFDLNPNDPQALENLKQLLLGSLGVCPTGQFLQGFTPEGNPQCQAESTPAPTIASASCPAGQFLQGISATGAPVCGSAPSSTTPVVSSPAPSSAPPATSPTVGAPMPPAAAPSCFPGMRWVKDSCSTCECTSDGRIQCDWHCGGA